MPKTKLSAKQKIDPKVIALLVAIAIISSFYIARSFAADPEKANDKPAKVIDSIQLEPGAKQK